MIILDNNGVTFPDGSAQPKAGPSSPQAMILGTAQATTSGTAVDFTSIPTWAKRITLSLDGVSTSGTSFVQVQIGAGSIDTAGYTGGSGTQTSASGVLILSSITAADVFYGQVVFIKMGGNKWAVAANVLRTLSGTQTGCGTKTLAGDLDRLRLTTVNGTDLFDLGSVNILIEGNP